jgi:hypothetical protein
MPVQDVGEHHPFRLFLNILVGIGPYTRLQDELRRLPAAWLDFALRLRPPELDPNAASDA